MIRQWLIDCSFRVGIGVLLSISARLFDTRDAAELACLGWQGQYPGTEYRVMEYVPKREARR